MIKYKELECSKLMDVKFDSLQDFSRFVDGNKVVSVRFDMMYPTETKYHYDEYYTKQKSPEPFVVISYEG